MPEKIICQWARSTPLMIEYHDKEWGTPLHNDQKHFEFIILDGAQAGLSWSTVLNKRENYRRAFDNFEVEKVARYNARKLESLMKDEGIIRNRLKVQSTVTNAKAFLKVQEEFGDFDSYIWQFVGGETIVNRWAWGQIPAKTKESDAMSKDLLARGFKFVGSTICYAYMQASGMVNDHTTDCWRWKALAKK
jgi:DNA-3-methyladenine glycosylase I